ncbi:MAG: sulfotransferase, partial [Woeseiaceae bacterium]|nr:sulfotransferase [Woeseiaceae bacterium]
EGTSELPVLSRLAASTGRYLPEDTQFPKSVLTLKNRDWRALGQQYLEETRRHRLTERPRFTDKLPNNFPLVGLLHLILPNATVINARRHPLDSCLGCYKQLFARGQTFTYDIEDLAHYYRNYDTVMQHWHRVLPGKVLDVHYEETVTDLEAQVRRILEHCGLPFEEACVRFHETERAVKTASSEQVRQPIYTGALGTWRNYRAHLGLWQEELADIIERLPEGVRAAAG